MNFAKPLKTILGSAVAQVCSLSASHALWSANAPFPITMLGACIVAMGICRLLRLRPEIVMLNGLFPLAAFVVFNGEFQDGNATWLMVIAIFLGLLFAPTIYSGVPYYPTHRKVYQAVRDLLPQSTSFSFYDLGCGDGRLLAYLAHELPHGRFYGCELSPLAWFFATIRCIPYRSRVTIYFSDLWRADVSHMDVVYNFLAPPVMARLWMKLSTETKPGALLISNAFEFPVKADQIITFDKDDRSQLFMYSINH